MRVPPPQVSSRPAPMIQRTTMPMWSSGRSSSRDVSSSGTFFGNKIGRDICFVAWALEMASWRISASSVLRPSMRSSSRTRSSSYLTSELPTTASLEISLSSSLCLSHSVYADCLVEMGAVHRKGKSADPQLEDERPRRCHQTGNDSPRYVAEKRSKSGHLAVEGNLLRVYKVSR